MIIPLKLARKLGLMGADYDTYFVGLLSSCAVEKCKIRIYLLFEYYERLGICKFYYLTNIYEFILFSFG